MAASVQQPVAPVTSKGSGPKRGHARGGHAPFAEPGLPRANRRAAPAPAAARGGGAHASAQGSGGAAAGSEARPISRTRRRLKAALDWSNVKSKVDNKGQDLRYRPAGLGAARSWPETACRRAFRSEAACHVW